MNAPLSAATSTSFDSRWPDEVALTVHGNLRRRPSVLFLLGLHALRRARPQFHWVPFFKLAVGEGIPVNAITRWPKAINALEAVFAECMGAGFSGIQRRLMLDADLVLVGICKQTGEVAGYCCHRHLPAGEIPGLVDPVSAPGQVFFAKHFQNHKLASLAGCIMLLYGHTLSSAFRDQYLIFRTNNRHLVSIQARAGEVMRSDRLAGQDGVIQAGARTAIAWAHRYVWQLHGVPLSFDRPITNTHAFNKDLCLPGLGPREMVYTCVYVSMARFFWRCVLRPPKPRRS